MVRVARNLLVGMADGEEIKVSPSTLRTGIHVVGPSGSGKTRFLELLIRQQIAVGQGICVLDPTGALYARLAQWCAARGLHRRRPIHFIDPNNPNEPIGLQPLALGAEEEIAGRVDGLVAACARAFDEDHRRTPLLKRMLRAIFTVLMEERRPLTDALEFVLPDRGRSELARGARSGNPYVARIWERLQTAKDERLEEQLSSVSNRLSEFLMSDRMRDLFGGTRPSLNWRTVMDQSQIVLVNLQPTQLSADNMRLIGTLITSELLLAARARSNAHADAHPFTCFIDEAPRFLNEDIEHAVDEMRQKGLAYVAAHQRLSQLQKAGPSIYAGVMSIQTKVIFGGLSADDTRALATELFQGAYDEDEEVAPLRRPVVVRHEVRRNAHERITSGQSAGTQASATDTRGVSRSDHSGVQVPLDALGILAGSFGDTSGRAVGEQAAKATTAGTTTTSSEQNAAGWAEAAWPVLEERPGGVRSFEAQMQRYASQLHLLPQRHACVRLRGGQPTTVEVPYVGDPVTRVSRLPVFFQEAATRATAGLMPPIVAGESSQADAPVLEDPDHFFE